MKRSHAVVVGGLCLAYHSVMLLLGGTANGYDIALVPYKTNFSEGERLCKLLGFDGFAVLNTPEAFEQALNYTAELR